LSISVGAFIGAAVEENDDSWYAVDLPGGEIAYIDQHGQTRLRIHAEKAQIVFREELAEFSNGMRAGYINRKGEIAVPDKFLRAMNFSEGLAAACVEGGYYGYIDTTGEFVIDPKYDSAGEFKGGIARVGIETRESAIRRTYADVGMTCQYFYIDRQGDRIPPDQPLPDWAPIEPFDFFEKKGLANDRGDIYAPPVFEDITYLGDDRVGIKIGEMWGIARKPSTHHQQVAEWLRNGVSVDDDALEWICEPQFDQVTRYDDSGAARYCLHEKFGLVDYDGEFITPARFSELQATITESRRKFRDGSLVGYLDENHNVVIPPQFAIGHQFDGPLARVEIEDGQQALINRSGEVVWSKDTPQQRHTQHEGVRTGWLGRPASLTMHAYPRRIDAFEVAVSDELRSSTGAHEYGWNRPESEREAGETVQKP
jgi:hypothetical protein